MSHELAPRPTLSDDETAALLAAAEEIASTMTRRSVRDETPAWRFSGRWFNRGPLADRRPRRS